MGGKPFAFFTDLSAELCPLHEERGSSFEITAVSSDAAARSIRIRARSRPSRQRLRGRSGASGSRAGSHLSRMLALRHEPSVGASVMRRSAAFAPDPHLIMRREGAAPSLVVLRVEAPARSNRRPHRTALAAGRCRRNPDSLHRGHGVAQTSSDPRQSGVRRTMVHFTRTGAVILRRVHEFVFGRGPAAIRPDQK